ncbi:hypothetical protein [Roseibium sp. RKSG952]|uniref:hypothetical protein n=1 Tax=Roseibium sp. RKSG952 TaxID=2529384 RepID=UPI0034CFE9BD
MRASRQGSPRSPDPVFRKRRIAVFVHGCFWHFHPGCHPDCQRAMLLRTRREWWRKKISTNVLSYAHSSSDRTSLGFARSVGVRKRGRKAHERQTSPLSR